MRTSRTIKMAAFGLAVASIAAAGALASSNRVSGTLELNGSFNSRYQFGDYCPSGTPEIAECVRFSGEGLVPGLGRATSTYTKVLPGDDEACPVIQFNTAVIAVAGKGELELSRAGKVCGPTAPAAVAPLAYVVNGGTGAYAGASGSLQFRSSVYAINLACRCGRSLDSWTGTVTVPGTNFDVSAPTLTGAVSKTVRTSKRAKRVRVRYGVVARDAIDGSVPVACKPRSGSFFPLGRTKVFCTATDSSGNEAQARFTISVRHARA